MKMMQQEGSFRPIALVLETEADALLLWEIIDQYFRTGNATSEEAYQMSIRISSWFNNEAKL